VSKRSWTPTQKGTERFPNTTQAPTKLVIRGVQTGTPLYQAVASAFGGRLKQFHGKAQQDYSLGINQVYRRHIEWLDGRATYTNLQGQEILELEVDHHFLEQLEKQAEDYWDFALIELVAPNIYAADGGLGLAALARLNGPIEEKIVSGITWPVAGLATNFREKDTPDKMINAAEAGDFVRTVTNDTGDDRIFSVTVDLRPARGLSAAVVDLHAFIEGRTEVLPNTVWLTPGGVPETTNETPLDSNGNPITDADWNTIMTDNPDGFTGSLFVTAGELAKVLFTNFSDGLYTGWPNYTGNRHSITDGFGNVVEYSDLPPVHFDRLSLTWKFQANGADIYAEPLGDTIAGTILVGGTPTQQLITGSEWYRHWKVISPTGYRPPYEGPAGVPGEVRVTLFKGVPRLSVSSYEALFFRWDFTDVLPRRAGYATVGRPAIPAGTSPFVDDPAQMYGLPKLGTITLPLKMPLGPSWQPA
jgi:hypothetical protein